MFHQKDCNNCCSLFLCDLLHGFCVNLHSSESEHIGYAMKWPLESVRASRYPNQPWNMVAGLRHRFVHVYDGINWSIIVEVVFEDMETSVYKGYKRDKIEMRGDRAEISDFPLYLNTVAGGLDCRDQTIGGFSSVVKIYAVPVVEIIGQLLYLLGRYGFNAQFSDCL